MTKGSLFLNVKSVSKLHSHIFNSNFNHASAHSFFQCTFCTACFILFFACCNLIRGITSCYILYIRLFCTVVQDLKPVSIVLCNIWCTRRTGGGACLYTLPSKCNSQCFSFCKYVAVLQPLATFSVLVTVV